MTPAQRWAAWWSAPRPGALFTLLIASMALAIPAHAASRPAAARQAGEKPRLVVKSVKADSGEQKPLHRFLRGPGMDLLVKIENKGEARTRSGDRSGVLLSKASGALSFSHETTFEFPALKPGKTAEVQVSVTGTPFGKPDQIDTATPKACVPRSGKADFDSDGNLKGRKDCGEGPQFAVIPRVWSGTMSSTQPVFGYGKLASDASPTFRYSANVSNNTNAFVYGGLGDLIHAVSGSNGTCSIRGGKNSTIGPGEAGLVLQPDLLTYHGFMNSTDVFTATQTCNGHDFPTQIRTTGIPIPSTNRADESETKLKGTGSAGSATYRWELDAR